MKEELKVLPNGLRVMLVPCEAESVAVGVFVASGSRHETAKTAGISHFIEHMLFKGTPTRSPIDITRAIEGRGGNFNACTGEESTCYFAHLPCEYVSEAVDILADMYLNATIPDDEFAREKQVVIEEIRMYADDPESVVTENLQRSLFPGDTLGAPVAGTPESLAPMTPDDLRDYIAAHYVAARTVVVLVGAFDPEKALKDVARRFASLGGPRVRRASRAPRFRPPVPEVTVRKDVQQVQLALGYRTFGLDDDRSYAASLMDAVLGRGMMSRLFQQVRERRGLSYDIASRYQCFSNAGMFTVTAGIAPANCKKTLETVDRELARIRSRPVPAAELERTKEFITGNFRLAHERITSKMFFYGNSVLNFGRAFSPRSQVEKIRAVTARDVQAVANDILDPGRRAVSWVLPQESPQIGKARRD